MNDEMERPPPESSVTGRYWRLLEAGLLATSLTGAPFVISHNQFSFVSNPPIVSRVQEGGESLTTTLAYHPVADEPLWLSYVNRRLAEMTLDPDESERSRLLPNAPSRALLEARRLVPDKIVPPSVIPSDEGGILFVWHKGGWDLEIAVEERETTAWGRDRASGQYWAGSVSGHEQELAAVWEKMTLA